MANLTITVDADLLRRARILALERGTSVNAVLREFLEEFVKGRASRAAAVEHLLALAARSRSRRGGRRWTRDELYD